MTSGCTLHETLATVVARRSTTPAGVRGLEREGTMVLGFLIDREAKVDVQDYMRTSCARVKRLYRLSAHRFFFSHFDGFDSDLCRGEESEQQPRRHQQKIVES